MKTAIQIFLKQTQRGTKRLVLQLVLLCAAVTFLVVSLNLYQNSTSNLLSVENAYTTIATMDFRAYVNSAGEIVSPEDPSCVGQHWLSLEDYDFSQLLALDSVKNIELRTRVGAYIPGSIPHYGVIDKDNKLPDDWMEISPSTDVIKFVLDTEEPVVIPLKEKDWTAARVPFRILENSNSMLRYPGKISFRIQGIQQLREWGVLDEIRRLNRNDSIDSITLYPDVEYVVAVNVGEVWEKDSQTGVFTWVANHLPSSGDGPFPDVIECHLFDRHFFGEYKDAYLYEGYAAMTVPGETKAPFPLQRCEDVEGDALWETYTNCFKYSSNAFAVTLTNDHRLIPAWNQRGMYLHAGRRITAEEYASGAKVCMVSAEMADYQGWKVGDTLDMHLYAHEGFWDETSVIEENRTHVQNVLQIPFYNQNCGGFFEEDSYTIVGIYGLSQFTEFGDVAPEVFFAPWNTIYIPANAAPDAPKGPIQPSLLTIVLKNGRHLEFEKAVEELGLTEEKPGTYKITIEAFDQGYGKIKLSLIEMNRNAKLLLGLSSVLLAVTLVMMAFLFSRQHKHSAGILRMLGGSKGQAFAAILACAATVVMTSGVAGALIGGGLTSIIGRRVLGSAAESAVVTLHAGADRLLTLLTALSCIVLFLLLTAIFTATYIGKEPRQLLPEDKG